MEGSARQEDHTREEMPRILVTRKRAMLFGLFVLVSLGLLYAVLPQLAVVKHTLDRLNDGDVWWIAVAVVLELLSIASYIAIFKGVHVPPGSPIGVRESYLIMMAGLAATRLFAAGGAGGVAVTAWALRRSGMERREVAQRMIAFLVLIYGVYMVAMIVCGVGLYLGVFAGENPFAITIGPAIVGAVAILAFLAIALVPEDLGQRLEAARGGIQGTVAGTGPNGAVPHPPGIPHPSGVPHPPGRWVRWLAAGPASLSGGVRYAWSLLRHPEWALAGTIGWWGFNIGVLYASFRVFGDAPPPAVLVQAYFVGMLANLLPLPGGIGGVDGGMIGALAAFGVSVGIAVPAVLTYRLFAFWLPSIPGAIAYFQLRKTVSRWDHEPSEAPGQLSPALTRGSVAA
ncbi:MAG TPA: lysylphosphatidylglycerol synthase transmembrane domain-containing protein [Solirubrobacteraceae bacterium]|nr:lysylphosphatidylglycerol synthase transmembrane domain-containing protein [Solirubrobacteraceae bacterium]